MTPRKRWGVAGAVAALVILAAPFVVARIVARTVIARSSAHGVTLTIDSASPSLSGVVLRGLSARLQDIPEASATVSEVEVVLLGTHKARASGVRVDVRGSAEALREHYATWRNKTAASTRPRLLELEVSGIHASWSSSLGPESLIETFDGTATLSADGSRASVSSLVQIGFGPTTLQTLSVRYEEAARRATFVAAPLAKTLAGASARAEIDHERIVTFALTIPRGPLAAWVTDKRALGYNASVEVGASVVLTPTGAPAAREGRARVELKLFGAKFQSGSLPLDASLAIDARRASDDTIALERGSALFGPLRGDLKGSLGIGAHLWSKLTFTATPIPCSRFVSERRNAEAGSIEEMAGNVTSLLAATGIARLEGSVGLEAQLDLDLDRKDRARFHWKTLGGCALALF
jgi:hypothetical protein